jgi:hypothetical protein
LRQSIEYRHWHNRKKKGWRRKESFLAKVLFWQKQPFIGGDYRKESEVAGKK